MKTIKFILSALIATTLFTGCKKWLDVQPVDQISDDKLFENVDGYRNAVNGLYEGMSLPNLYGRELSWGTASVLAQDYAEGWIAYSLQWIAEYDYKTNADAVKQVAAPWGTAYNVIANCNKVIAATETKDVDFFPLKASEKNLILGEAMAVRASLHFDLLRLYAPAPIDNMTGSFIPYMSVYPALVATPLPTGEVLKKVIDDLEKAAVLVAENDTLAINNRTMMSVKLQSLFAGGNVPKGGLFFNFRMHRFNYVAIHALLARVYLYAGDKVKAKKEAEYIYKEFGPSGRLKWWAFTPEYNTTGDNKYPKLVDDVIMAFYDANLPTNIRSYRQTYYTYQLSSQIMSLYPIGERDYRANLINRTTSISAKWPETPSTGQYVGQQNYIMPFLRMSEIYYIYSECLFDEGNTTDALRVLNELRYARGKTTTFSSTNKELFYDELFNEYHREFMEEGQTVFAHKRLKRDIMLGTQRITMDNKFVLPIPQGEKIF